MTASYVEGESTVELIGLTFDGEKADCVSESRACLSSPRSYIPFPLRLSFYLSSSLFLISLPFSLFSFLLN